MAFSIAGSMNVSARTKAGAESGDLSEGLARVGRERVEERGEVVVCAQRKHVRDVLVRPDDDDAAVARDPAQVEDVAGPGVRAEHLLVIDEAVAPLPGEQKVRHAGERELAMPLLEDGPHVEERVDVASGRRVPPDRGSGRVPEKGACG